MPLSMSGWYDIHSWSSVVQFIFHHFLLSINLLCHNVHIPLSSAHSSVNLSRSCILRIMTSRPMVTMMSSARPNQPRTIAVVPTPLLTAPLPKSDAICAADTEAVCCHNTLTRTKIDAMKISASAACDTGRDGNGLMSISLPVRASLSSCHPGNVASRRKSPHGRHIKVKSQNDLCLGLRVTRVPLRVLAYKASQKKAGIEHICQWENSSKPL